MSNVKKAIAPSSNTGPRFYQQEAIDAVLKIFKTHQRTHIVMACGSGKSRVGLWIGVSVHDGTRSGCVAINWSF